MTKQSFRLKSYVIIYIQQKNSHPYGKVAPTSYKGSPYIQQRKSLHVAKEASHTAKGAIDTQKAGTYIRLYTLYTAKGDAYIQQRSPSEHSPKDSSSLKTAATYSPTGVQYHRRGRA